MINWKSSKAEALLIGAIAARAKPLYEKMGESQATANMDISACHLNGCPLDLPKLREAEQMDFTHDILGIRKHINRETGQLEGVFHPRCALSNS